MFTLRTVVVGGYVMAQRVNVKALCVDTVANLVAGPPIINSELQHVGV
jgi:hypothetical protein